MTDGGPSVKIHPLHLGVLVGFARDGGREVLVRRADRLVRGRVARRFQVVQVTVGVAGLGLGRVAERAADVRVTLDVGLARELEVAAVRLGFAGERVLEILMGLAALDIRRARSLSPSLNVQRWMPEGGS